MQTKIQLLVALLIEVNYYYLTRRIAFSCLCLFVCLFVCFFVSLFVALFDCKHVLFAILEGKRLQRSPWKFLNRWIKTLGSPHWIRQVAAPCNGARCEICRVCHHLLLLDAMHKHGLCRHAMSVRHVRVLCQNGLRYGHYCYRMWIGNCTQAFK